MALPRIPQGSQRERAGILAVAGELNRLGLIWRETPSSDVGIDGQIELVDDSGCVTGRLAAVQVKSGDSFFARGTEDEWHFYPEEKHRVYWERFPLPVLLFLHSTGAGTYWVDVRQELRSPERARLRYIGVPKENRLDVATRSQFFASVGASSRPIVPVAEVLTTMAAARSPSASLPIGYLDLFANGLTNIGRSVYYGMDMVVGIAETLLNEMDEDQGFGLGRAENEFLFTYVLFLVEQQIADIDVSDCLVDWVDRMMHPTFVAPLTSRGRALVQLIHELQSRFEEQGRLTMPSEINLAQETFIRIAFTGTDYVRIPLIHKFGVLLSEARSNVSS